MADEPDKTTQGENIDVIRQLLQKLEEVAVTDLDRAPQRATETAAQRPVPIVLDFERAPDPPLAVPPTQEATARNELATLRRPGQLARLPTGGVAELKPDALPAHNLEPAAPLTWRGVAATAAMVSFTLGAICAAALVYVLEPFKKQPERSVVVSAPSPPHPASPVDPAAPAETVRIEPAVRTPASGSIVAESQAPAAAIQPPGSPTPVVPSPAAVATISVEPKPAASIAALPVMHALSVPSRLEANGVGRIDYPLRIEPMPTEASALLVVFRGLPDWMTLSKGSTLGNGLWLLPAHDASDLAIEIEDRAEGIAEVRVELATRDGRILARSITTVRAVSKPAEPPVAGAPAARISPEELQQVIGRGEVLLDTGELEPARVQFRKAAQSGSHDGALKLAQTYDPEAVQRLGLDGAHADLGLARQWYEQARALGSMVAQERLSKLGAQ